MLTVQPISRLVLVLVNSSCLLYSLVSIKGQTVEIVVVVMILTLIFMVEGAREVISFCILSAMPGYMVVPPDSTVLAYRSLRMSTSHFMMEL